ncbi:MAG: hydrogenase accessory protein HypA [Desulfobulbus propionicus]|nr:MAG: hydrogenase accessory protein HypA [Desulfobulbus propionicus]
MHELSLAQNLMDQLLELAREHGATKITRVDVLIGPFSGIVTDSFGFGFNVLKNDQPVTAEAELVLETPDPKYRCLDCHTLTSPGCEQHAEDHMPGVAPHKVTVCNNCGSSRLSPQGGTELILKQLEME